MFASRIYRISQLTWKVLFLVLVFVSFTFSVSEALASPVVSAEHVTLEGSYVIRENTFHLSPANPSIVDGIEFTVVGIQNIRGLRVKLSSNGAWFACRVVHLADQIKANCDTSQGAGLRVEEMDRIQIAAAN